MVASDGEARRRSRAWLELRDAYCAHGDDDARRGALCAYILQVGPILAAGFGRWPLLGLSPEDAAAMACSRAWQRFCRLRRGDDGTDLATRHAAWAFVVLRSIVRDLQRAARARCEGPERNGRPLLARDDDGDELTHDPVDPIDQVDAWQRSADARAALAALLSDDAGGRMALLIEAGSGRPYAELAEARGVAQSHYRTMVFRARKALAMHPAALAWHASYG